MSSSPLRYVLAAVFLAGVALVPLGAAGQEETAAAPDEAVVLTFKLRPNSPGFDPDVAQDIAEFERMTADAGTPVTVDLQYFAGPNAEYTTKPRTRWSCARARGRTCCSRRPAGHRITCGPGS